MSALLPLLGARALEDPIAWREGRPLSTRAFLAAVQRQAQALPVEGALVNLCTDRGSFAIGLAAALVRGHTSLLPANARAETLAALRSRHPALYLLTDDDSVHAPGVPRVEALRQPDAAPAGETPMPQVAAEAVAACLLTSGSTGEPQPHDKTWGALTLNIGAEAARIAEVLGRRSLAGLNVVATVPAQHSYGFESSVLLALLGGAALDGGRPFYPADIVAALARLPRPRALVTTPFHLKTLLRAGLALPPADVLLSATAPLSPQLAAEAERAFGAPLLEIYGCTEAGQVASRRPVHSEVWRTLGALAIRREGEGDAERFVVEGGHVLAPTPLADVLELESPHAFRLLGRSNDIVNVAGKRSSLAHLNYHLNSIEGVQDGSFWLPDDVPDGVVRPVAFVVAPQLPAAEIVAQLRTRLEAVFVPRRVVHVQALPREATGKLTAASLRAFAMAHLLEEAR